MNKGRIIPVPVRSGRPVFHKNLEHFAFFFGHEEQIFQHSRYKNRLTRMNRFALPVILNTKRAGQADVDHERVDEVKILANRLVHLQVVGTEIVAIDNLG